tara:strand:+ start:31999 stop:32322 length:324 start_codon:yes stop_codon:yes gene_type:complete
MEFEFGPFEHLEIHIIRDNESLWTYEIDLPGEKDPIYSENKYSSPFIALFDCIEYLQHYHLKEYIKLKMPSYDKSDFYDVFNISNPQVISKKTGEQLILNKNKKESK